MPDLRPFRALRFNAASTDLSAVLAPPYDIISPAQRLALLEQDPHNVVRIELPADVGSGNADDYRGAAETVQQWRADDILIKDAAPTVTIHEMSWQDADGQTVRATGLIARLKLEEFGPGSGVLPHERTMSGPKKDRYELLDATLVNTAPLVFLAGSEANGMSSQLSALAAGPADAEATTGDGVHHRLWICDGSVDGVSELPDAVAASPVTIADGHHRYETALKFRRDRAASNDDDHDHDAGGEAPWDYVMALVYSLEGAPPALPTHRVLQGGPVGDTLLEQLAELFTIEPVDDRAALLARMSDTPLFETGATGTGRFGVQSGGRVAILTVKREATDPLLDADLSEASKGLDANALTAAINEVYGADPGALAEAGRLSYVKDATEATQLVQDGEADTVFLLDLMPTSAISDVAEAGEVMPQKSTYFNPKAPTGLLLGPLEW